MKRKVLLPAALFCLIVFVEVVINMALAFDYEHPEKLSAGDCWITLPDGSVIIRSGRECPKPPPKAQEPLTDSVPFWNNTGHPSYGRRYQGGHHGRQDDNRSSDNAGFKNEYPVHPVLPNLPADQKLFQEINKNLYPGVSNKTIKP